MKPYTTHDGQITHLKDNKELRLIKDILDEDKTIVQIHGPRGGMQGTIRVDNSDLRQALLLAGIGTSKTETTIAFIALSTIIATLKNGDNPPSDRMTWAIETAHHALQDLGVDDD